MASFSNSPSSPHYQPELFDTPIHPAPQTKSIIKGILRDGIKRLWPLWLAVFACWAVGYLLPVAALGVFGTGVSAFDNAFWSIEFGGVLFGATLSSVVSVLLTHDCLFRRPAGMFYGSLPLKRRPLFAATYATGLLPLLAIIVVIWILSTISCLSIEDGALNCFTWLILTVAITFVMYSTASFCAVLSGSRSVTLLLLFLVNFVVPGIEFALRTIGGSMTYGVDFTMNICTNWASPLVGMATTCLEEYWSSFEIYWPPLLGYCAFGVLCVVGANLIFARRNLECAGESITVPRLAPYLKYLAGVCMALFFGVIGLICFANSDYGNINAGTIANLTTLMIIGGFLGLLFSQMLISRSTHVIGKCAKGSIALGIACIAFMGAMALDVFNIVGYVPDTADVKTASITFQGEAAFTDEAEIDQVRTIHQQAISLRNEENSHAYDNASDSIYARSDFDWNSSTIYISYELKDGSTVERSYTIWYRMDNGTENHPDVPGNAAMANIYSLLNSPAGITARYSEFLNTANVADIEFTISYYDKSGDYGYDSTINIEFADAKDFIESALKPDLLDHGAGLLSANYGSESATELDSWLTMRANTDASNARYNNIEVLSLNTKTTPSIISWVEDKYGIALA